MPGRAKHLSRLQVEQMVRLLEGFCRFNGCPKLRLFQRVTGDGANAAPAKLAQRGLGFIEALAREDLRRLSKDLFPHVPHGHGELVRLAALMQEIVFGVPVAAPEAALPTTRTRALEEGQFGQEALSLERYPLSLKYVRRGWSVLSSAPPLPSDPWFTQTVEMGSTLVHLLTGYRGDPMRAIEQGKPLLQMTEGYAGSDPVLLRVAARADRALAEAHRHSGRNGIAAAQRLIERALARVQRCHSGSVIPPLLLEDHCGILVEHAKILLRIGLGGLQGSTFPTNLTKARHRLDQAVTLASQCLPDPLAQHVWLWTQLNRARCLAEMGDPAAGDRDLRTVSQTPWAQALLAERPIPFTADLQLATLVLAAARAPAGGTQDVKAAARRLLDDPDNVYAGLHRRAAERLLRCTAEERPANLV